MAWVVSKLIWPILNLLNTQTHTCSQHKSPQSRQQQLKPKLPLFLLDHWKNCWNALTGEWAELAFMTALHWWRHSSAGVLFQNYNCNTNNGQTLGQHWIVNIGSLSLVPKIKIRHLGSNCNLWRHLKYLKRCYSSDSNYIQWTILFLQYFVSTVQHISSSSSSSSQHFINVPKSDAEQKLWTQSAVCVSLKFLSLY